jgi:hypothetical protein
MLIGRRARTTTLRSSFSQSRQREHHGDGTNRDDRQAEHRLPGGRLPAAEPDAANANGNLRLTYAPHICPVISPRLPPAGSIPNR